MNARYYTAAAPPKIFRQHDVTTAAVASSCQ
jgi:hypothetical protein